MRRLPILLPLLAIVGSLLAVAPHAAAHQLQVLDPGPVELDVGTADPARLIHAVLVDPGDELVLTVARGGRELDLQMLVPDRAPESSAPAAELPSVTATWTGGALTTFQDGSSEPVVDDATGIGYLLVVATTIPAGRGPATIRVARGDQPTRVAVRVGPPTAFAASDVERTPRAALDARLWLETPPPGYEPPRSGRDSAADPERRYVWYGAGIAALGMLVAAWWIGLGRAAARRRGAERATLERDDT